MKISMKTVFTINPEIMESDTVVIYGAGGSGVKLFLALLNYEINIDYFCDSSSDKVGIRLMNKEVISFDALMEMKDRAAVLIGSSYFEEIYHKLTDAGFKHVYIFNKYILRALCLDEIN